MALFVVGFSAAIWYPVAKGETYRMLPGRSGAVQALSVMLGAPVSLGASPLIGLVARWFGIATGLGMPALAPIPGTAARAARPVPSLMPLAVTLMRTATCRIRSAWKTQLEEARPDGTRERAMPQVSRFRAPLDTQPNGCTMYVSTYFTDDRDEAR